MASVFRTIGLAALIAAAPGAAWAGSPSWGSYQADVWGPVELSTEHDRLVAYTTQAGACGFEPKRRVLEGELQGNVLVGQATVCLQGASCPQVEAVPVFGFYSPGDRSLVAYIRPREGCQVPMLGKGGLVVLQPMPRAAEAIPAETPVRTATSALRQVRRDPEASKEALDRGNQLLAAQDWSGSAVEFERSIAFNDKNWVAFFGLGTAHLMQGHAQVAIELLERARALNPKDSGTHYNLACSYSRLGDKQRALSSLEQAVKLGFGFAAGTQDNELDRLLGSDIKTAAAYTQLTLQANSNYTASAGRRQKTGP